MKKQHPPVRPDRTVHCQILPMGGGRIEIVRYDKGGHWYLEDGNHRRRLKLDEAARFAQDRPAVIWHEGLLGGRSFDAKVRRMRAEEAAK